MTSCEPFKFYRFYKPNFNPVKFLYISSSPSDPWDQETQTSCFLRIGCPTKPLELNYCTHSKLGYRLFIVMFISPDPNPARPYSVKELWDDGIWNPFSTAHSPAAFWDIREVPGCISGMKKLHNDDFTEQLLI